MRALSLRIAARLWAASPADSPASSSSAQAEMTATGVRSSWEASEVNCRSRSKERSSRSSMVLKVSASSCTSSLVAMPVIRRERSPARMLSAALVMEIEDSLWQMRRKTAPVRREEVKKCRHRCGLKNQTSAGVCLNTRRTAYCPAAGVCIGGGRNASFRYS